jgi:hypothetical protein
MKLRFYARDDQLVPMPGVSPGVGQLPMYVGRRFDAETSSWPAVETAVEFDSDTSAGLRLIELTRRDGALWPADEQTAALCATQFTKVQFKAGVFTVAMAPAVAERRTVIEKGSDS